MIITFSEPVTGVDASDFQANGTLTASATLTSVTPGPTAATYYVGFNYTGTSGSLQVAIKSTGTGISDVAGNAFVGGGIASTAAYPVNNTPPPDSTLPTITSFTAPTTVSASPANLTLVFNEAVTGVSADDFQLSTGATVGTVTGSGTTWTVPVSYTGTAPVSITVIGGATAIIRDAATHLFAGGNPAATVTFTPTSGTAVTAPAITSPLTATVVAGAPFSYTVTGSNSPTSFSATSLPAGLTFTSPNITGSVATPGVYNITVGATNTAGSDSKTLVLTVTAPGGSAVIPAVTSPLTATMVAGTPFIYTITGSNSPTSFTATGLPAGLTSTSPNITGTITTPGVYNVTIRATNAAGSDTETLILTVTAPGSGSIGGKGPVTVIKRGDGLAPGKPFMLPATTATGQPITWVLVSGNATLVGNVLTPKNKGAVVVRAFTANGSPVSGDPVAEYEIDTDDDDNDRNRGKSPHRDRLSNLSSRLQISNTDANRAAKIGRAHV